MADGFELGSPLRGGIASLVGGSASVVGGDAVDGKQYLRFSASSEGDALVLQAPPEVAAGRDREVSFAVRLAATTSGARLILTYGQTVTIEPVAAGLEVGVPGRSVIHVSAPGKPDGWMKIGLSERAREGVWHLLVNGSVVASDLPSGAGSSVLSDLLIFADGSLDVDDVRIVATAVPGDGQSASDESSGVAAGPVSDGTQAGTADGAAESRAARKGRLMEEALESARQGNLAVATVALAAITRSDRNESEQVFELAQLLTYAAFILHDEGNVRTAAMLSAYALRHLERARELPPARNGSLRLATCDYIAGKLHEQVLGDPAGAEGFYIRAVAADEAHKGAEEGIERVRRIRDELRARSTVDGEGGAR